MMHQTHHPTPHPTVEFRRKMFRRKMFAIAQSMEYMGKARSDWKIWLHGLTCGFLFGVIVGMCVIAQVI
jgi:hypothetical protein